MAKIEASWKDGKLEFDGVSLSAEESLGCDCQLCRSRLSMLMDTVATVGLRKLSASWMCLLGDTVVDVEMVVGAAADPEAVPDAHGKDG